MNFRSVLTSISLALGLALNFASAFATEVGETLPALTLKDQAGEEHTLSKTVRRIYANADRDGDKLMEAAMTGLDQSTLEAQQAVVIADISAAPGFVRRIIKSKLKDRSYTTWVDERGTTKKWLPNRSDRITVLELDQLTLTAIRFVSDEAELRAELLTPAAAPTLDASPEPSPANTVNSGASAGP